MELRSGHNRTIQVPIQMGLIAVLSDDSRCESIIAKESGLNKIVVMLGDDVRYDEIMVDGVKLSEAGIRCIHVQIGFITMTIDNRRCKDITIDKI